MMFLLRSAFWLSLVYAHMPLDQGEALRALDETRGVALTGAANAVAAGCMADHAACRAVLGAAVGVAAAPGAPRPAGPEPHAGRDAKGGRSSVNSLSATDLATPWRGPAARSGA
ncbi:MAG: hypothetical protein ABSG83_00235 [Roseiarcus sp.]